MNNPFTRQLPSFGAAPQPLNMPTPMAGLNQMSAPQPAPQPQQPSQMPVFKGFPGPFPSSQAPDFGSSPQQRAMGHISSLNLPPQVLSRLQATLNGESPKPAPTPTSRATPAPSRPSGSRLSATSSRQARRDKSAGVKNNWQEHRGK